MRRWQLYTIFGLLEVIIIIAGAVVFELKTSTFQAHVFSTVANELTYNVKPHESGLVRFPTVGPFDVRLGYTRIPSMQTRLLRRGYFVKAQAEISPRMRQLADLGIFPIYHEKSQAGLTVLDRRGEVIYSVTRPSRVFASFEKIPRVIVDTLLFIENREILDEEYPLKNPAIEWDRLGKAVIEKAIQKFYPDKSAPGGSTLATQLEKYRHAFEGRTITPADKFQQMVSASFRAYLGGPETMPMRHDIILRYINSIPLAALPGYGEVNGLGDGLWAWYGADLAETASLLEMDDSTALPEEYAQKALAYKQVLSLFIAHRRPSEFLLTSTSVLNLLVDEYLDILARQGVISSRLRDAAHNQELRLRSSAPTSEPVSYLDRKGANAIRTQLLGFLGYEKFYELDALDLRVHTSIDKDVQGDVTRFLSSIRDPEFAKKAGLVGERTLAKGDPAKVIYSVTLYERQGGVNLLRIQTDNYDRPFSINEGSRLDLGSTAKLRTLTLYLEIVSKLHERLVTLNAKDLQKELARTTDPLSKWATEWMIATKDRSLLAMCEAAMDRTYSANPGEAFFTGGGLHTFVNFKKEDNGKTPTMRESMRHSINLPFIRLMRDIVRYYMAQIPGSPTRFNDKMNEEARRAYLARFADKEGAYFLQRFYEKYRKLNPGQILEEVVKGIRKSPSRLAVVYRYVRPAASIEEFRRFLAAYLPESALDAENVRTLYEKYGPNMFSLNDQAFIARIHPLELWLVRHMMNHPHASFQSVVDNSANERQEVYSWLMKTRYRRAQDKRIRTLIETEAFLEILQAWKRVGYPFDNIVPSYATAIGSSGDRPMALAELVGIILNDGVRYPLVRIEDLHFAEGTPFESVFARRQDQGERLLKSEVARTLKKALMDVVENGTARRVGKVYLDKNKRPLDIGGKTGTGDHRFETFGPGGVLKSSRIVSRTATFVFFIGDRFFGTVTGHVRGEEAGNYDFTSALAAEVLKALEPEIRPLIQEEPESDFKPAKQVSCNTDDDKLSVDERVLAGTPPLTQAPPLSPLF